MAQLSHKKQKSSRRRWLPIMGLSLAILLAIVAYSVAFPLVEFGREQSDTINKAYLDLRNKLNDYSWYAGNEKYHGNNIAEMIIALALWLVMMGLAMFLVSVAVYGTDPEREAWNRMGPSPANKKALAKQLKKDLKEAKRRKRQHKKK